MDTDVLIVGAGPTGLFLASELARYDCSVRVIDKGEGTSVHSKALTIHARTLEAFSTRGLADRFVRSGLEAKSARVFVSGTERAELPFYEIDSPYNFVLILPQGETEQFLLEEYQAYGGTVEWGSELLDLSVEEDSVTARIGQNGESRDLRARWVIGCDGAHSRVRRASGIEWEGEDIDVHFALMDADVRSDLLDDESFQAFLLDDGRFLGCIPMPGGTQRIILTLIEARDEDDLNRRFFQELLARHVEEDIEIQETDWISQFTIRQRVADSFRAGRVCLAGDAAHAHSPAGGQGMNIGLQDAHNLAWKLRAVLEDRAGSPVLDTYDAERRPVAERVVRYTGYGTSFGGRQSWGMRLLRPIAMSLVPKISALRAKLLDAVSQLDVDYADSPIVRSPFGRRAGDLSAGQFAGNLPLEDGSRMHDHLKKNGRHVGVLPESAEIPAPLSSNGVPVVRISESTLQDHDFQSDGVLVLRPDGYIGYAGPVEANDLLSKYLTDARWGGAGGH